MAEVNIPDTILEQFRCSICTHYLSCAPVQILPNGDNVCNICSLSTEQPTYRQLTLEALLTELSFPCRFKNYGCGERVYFGQADEHEEKCAYRAYICPALTTCAWEGSVVQIPEHIGKEHANLMKENPEFKLQVDQDVEEIFIFMLDDVYFIVKYKYNATTSNLRYDIRFLTNIHEAVYKIRLTNDSDCDYNTNMKGGNILPYSRHLCTMQDSRTLILNNYMQVLNNPSCVTLAIKAVVITKFSHENAPVEELTVDYELLESLRCKRCRWYLTPPLYEDPFAHSPACVHCSYKFKYTRLYQKNDLKELVAKTNFPCRWRGCEFIGKAENLPKHEAGCLFRTFNCRNCDKTFTWTEALVHLENHGHKYFTDTFVYKVVFQKSYDQKNIFTYKNNEIIFIGHKAVASGDRHYIEIELHNTGICSFSVTLEFEHAHCKIKSKKFTLKNSSISGARICFSVEMLPDCFKSNEEVTVTMKII